MNAVKSAVSSVLAGRGYLADNVRVRKVSTITGMADGKKAIVSPTPDRITEETTNETDDIGYGVLITLAHAGNMNPEYSDTFDDLIEDREALRRYFINEPTRLTLSLPGTCEYFGLKVEPGPLLIAEHFQNNVDATALVLRVWVREIHA